MPRTKGAKDLKPRKISLRSLMNLHPVIDGYESAAFRIYAKPSVVRWFSRMDPTQKGKFIEEAMKISKRNEPESEF